MPNTIERDEEGRVVEYEYAPPQAAAATVAPAPVDNRRQAQSRPVDLSRFEDLRDIEEEADRRARAFVRECDEIRQTAATAAATVLGGPTRRRDAAVTALLKEYNDVLSRLKNDEERALRAAAARVHGEYERVRADEKGKYEEQRAVVNAGLRTEIDAATASFEAARAQVEEKLAAGLADIRAWRVETERLFREFEKERATKLAAEAATAAAAPAVETAAAPAAPTGEPLETKPRGARALKGRR